MKIAPFIHSCMVQHGGLAGNKVRTEVSSYDFEYEVKCLYCEKPLVTTYQLLSHIYRELTE